MKAYLQWLLFVGILALSFTVQAANHYVRSGAAGNGSGSDWTNASTSLPQSLVRGDTYYIADGTYGPYTFNTPLSGSSFIYIKKATLASHGTDTGWSSTYGDGEALFTSSGLLWTVQTGYLDIDGQKGTGKSPGNYGFRLYSTSSRCDRGGHVVYSGSITNLAIRHVDFDWNNGTSACSTGTTDSISTDINASDYVTIENNYFHHSSGFAIYLGNYTGHPVQSHYSIKGNYFYHNGGGGGPTAHWELMWLTDFKNSEIANNVIEDVYGFDGQTGWLMFGRADTVNIYGNLFFCSTDCAVGGNGVIADWSSDMYQNNAIHIYNNTFANISG
ncbi:MAG: right-handed parallel beta-helix repeat-containing protein, partial [Pseudobdellovibrionaceae bacterium]